MVDKHLEKGGEDVETIVGPSVKVEGDFASEGNIIIEGQVTGKIKTSKLLRVEEGAKVNADVAAESAVVAGEVRGNIKLNSTLELTPTAKIYGDITVKTLIIAAGAIFNGHSLMDETEEKGRGSGKGNKKGDGYEINSLQAV